MRKKNHPCEVQQYSRTKSTIRLLQTTLPRGKKTIVCLEVGKSNQTQSSKDKSYKYSSWLKQLKITLIFLQPYQASTTHNLWSHPLAIQKIPRKGVKVYITSRNLRLNIVHERHVAIVMRLYRQQRRKFWVIITANHVNKTLAT